MDCRKKAEVAVRKRAQRKTQAELVQGKNPNDHILYQSDEEVLDNVRRRPELLKELAKLAEVEGEKHKNSIKIIRIGEEDEADVEEYCPPGEGEKPKEGEIVE